MNDTVKAVISDTVKMQRMQLNEKYLGIPLFIGRNKQSCCAETVDKMDFRLQAWQGKLVNQDGHSTQIQDVVGAMAHFQMICMKIPNKIIDQMEALKRNYWWNKNYSKGCYFIWWKNLNKPKRLWGLGFKNMKYLNEAMLTKIAWRMLHNREAKWVQLLEARHFKNEDLMYDKIKEKGTWI
ncbi:uncharacterized protein LOC113311596 [Papaver somniferum]|uniref:uncharacterized protein LOC113311596 n=1 Tax=Papaver somniferum TaxID=3469 RepID=UPI000E70331D|nr:uncharacterized protein LOC113311596 [Papaver somniferum]